MKLLTELNEQVQYLVEGEEGAKRHYIQGVFAEGEVVNRNKRFYPIDILEKEVNRYVNENVKKNSAYGELNHPTGPGINLDRSCILIKEINQDNNTFIGKALVTSTPMGSIVKGLISDGARLGVSTRALGSLAPMNENVSKVQADLRLLAVDVVADPSAPNAFINGIMENVDYIFDAAKNTYVEQYIDETRKAIRKMTKAQVDNAKLALFEDFLVKVSRQ